MKAWLVRWSPLAILAVAWELAPRLGVVSAQALPPLSAILAAMVGLARSGDLASNGLASLTRLLAGLGLAVVAGVLGGSMMAWYGLLRIVLGPLVRCLYPLPKTALIPVLLLWLGLGDASKVALIFLGSLLPILVSTFNGVRGLDETMIWSARSLGRSRLRVLFEVGLPGAMPEILAGLRTAMALSFILLVSSEFLMARNGLGYLISFLGDGGVYPAMFAVVLVVAMLGFVADRAFLLLSTRLLAWRVP